MTDDLCAATPDFNAECAACPTLHLAENRADAIAGMIGVARALALQGRPLDLSGLEQNVGALCAQALDLDRPQGRVLRSRLVGLLHALDTLADVLPRPDPSG